MTMALLPTAPVVIRPAHGSDGAALHRLAALHSAQVPTGEILIAETGGALVAAHSPATGVTIADPFSGTAEVVELLELRGTMIRAA
jgi:hypothetical protein